jgi:hypothetical protein
MTVPLSRRPHPDAIGAFAAANVDAAVRLIDAAKRDGADYVQTPR